MLAPKGGNETETMTMTELQHTPGPWSLDYLTTKGGRNKRGLRGGGKRICDITIYDDQANADARLIASAPDLLEALNIARCYVRDTSAGIDISEYTEMAKEDLAEIDTAIARAAA